MDMTAYINQPGGLLVYPSRPCPGCEAPTEELWLCPDCAEAADRVVELRARRWVVPAAPGGRPAEVETEREVAAERELVA